MQSLPVEEHPIRERDSKKDGRPMDGLLASGREEVVRVLACMILEHGEEGTDERTERS